MSRELSFPIGSGVAGNVYNDQGVYLADPSPAYSAAPTLRYNIIPTLWPSIAIST
jgi:hypothetical protein